MRYASASSITSPCSAQYPAMEFSVNGSVCSLKGNCTLSFCVSLNRSCGTRNPSTAEAPPFSTRYREPASAAVISLVFFRIKSSNCSTSRVSDNAMPTRFSSSSSRVAFEALSSFPRVLGTGLGGDFLILAIERGAMNRRGRALRGNREYIESPEGRHAKCEPPSRPIGHKPKRIRHLRAPVAKERVISRVQSLSPLLWLC